MSRLLPRFLSSPTVCSPFRLIVYQGKSTGHQSFVPYTPLMIHPPKLAQRFLHTFCRPDLAEDIQGDLDESFADWVEIDPTSKAQWRYWREVLLLFRPGIIRSLSLPSSIYLPIDMWKNYVKTAWRQMNRQRLFTALNVLGLATGLSVCLLIIMVLVDQYSYDRFHVHKDDLYRVLSGHGEKGDELKVNYASSPLPLAEELRQNYSWVSHSVGFIQTWPDLIYHEKPFSRSGIYADSNFLQAFSFGWLKGDKRKALDAPNQIVLTAGTARDIFGTMPELGTLVEVDGLGECTLVGLMPDVPIRSHLQFDFLLSISSKSDLATYDWEQVWMPHVFVQLRPGTDPRLLDEALASIAQTRTELSEDMAYGFAAQAFSGITPGRMDISNDSGKNFPALILHLLAGFALLILVLAGFNYTNLSTARALRRAREISIRKVAGARRPQIIAQLLVESVLISVLALGLAIVMLEYLIPGFYGLDPEITKFFNLERTPWLYLGFFGFAILVGVLAGWIPARFLSAYQPVEGLKKLKNLNKLSYRNLRKSLIVIQFIVCFAFTLTTLTILQQKEHLLSVDLGLNTEHVVNVELQGVAFERFATEAKQVPGVANVSASHIIPLANISTQIALGIPGESAIGFDYNRIAGDYLNTLDIELLAGEDEVILPVEGKPARTWINQQAVAKLGFASAEEAVGQLLYEKPHRNDSTEVPKQYRIAGVVKDFHYRSLNNANSRLNPTALIVGSDVSYANVLLDGQNLSETLEGLKGVWEAQQSQKVFSYQFFDEKIESAFILFNLASKVLGLVGILAVIIASMGLLGMVVYAVEGRMKEVGIRKVLGASMDSLIWQLSREFVILLGIAAVIALPLSLFVNQQWLMSYSFRIPLSLNVILPTLAIVGALSLWVILSQAIRAARVSPTDILSEE